MLRFSAFHSCGLELRGRVKTSDTEGTSKMLHRPAASSEVMRNALARVAFGACFVATLVFLLQLYP